MYRISPNIRQIPLFKGDIWRKQKTEKIYVNVTNSRFELGKCTHYIAADTKVFTGIMSVREQRYNVPYLVTICQEMK
jgi:hypothetical protein